LIGDHYARRKRPDPDLSMARYVVVLSVLQHPGYYLYLKELAAE
jgi:hypothetical protein